MSSTLYLPETCDLERLVLWEGEPHAMAFREIPAGQRFRMGSRGALEDENPPHWVRLTEAFWMAETPVTQRQYRFLAEECLAELEKIEGNEGVDPSHFKGDDERPVESVNWHEARRVATELNDLPELRQRNLAAELPTETQWECACKAGTTTAYHTGDGDAALEAAGWYGGNSRNTTHPVRRKAMNGFGLYDMHGNVWEWCRDAWNEHAYQQRPTEVEDPLDEGGDDTLRVYRGGSWIFAAWFARSAFRDWREPGVRLRDLGFRLCLSPGPVARRAVPQPAEGGREGSGADGAAPGAGGVRVPPWRGLKPPESPD